MTENQLHDCMLQLFYDDPIYNVYNITNIFYSLPSDIKLSYFLSMRSNHWNDYKFIFLNSWLEINLLSTDCMSLSLSGECRDNNIFVLLMKSSYIVLDYSSSLTNFLTTQEWNIAVSDEMILFRLSSTTKNLLNAWLHVSQEPIPKYDDFLSYYSRYVEITNVNSQDSLLAESVPTTPRNLPSRVLVNNSQILITTIDDLATSLFVVGKISSSMNSFEISVLFTSVWNTLCADAPSPEDISDAFITYVTRLPLEINRAITRLFDACKARMTQSKLSNSLVPDIGFIRDIYQQWVPLIHLRQKYSPLIELFKSELPDDQSLEILLWCYVALRDATVKKLKLSNPPYSYEQTMTFSSYLYDTISLALHLSTFLTNDKSRSKMNFQILLEIQNNFLHRLNSMSIDDDLNLQYKYDLLVHKCRLAPIASNVDDYLACLKQLQEVIDTLQEVDNIYPLNPVQLEFPSFPPITIKIDHRRIQSTEIYELYLNHGEYLCDIGYQVEGINYMENGLEMILNERNEVLSERTRIDSSQLMTEINSRHISLLIASALCSYDYSRKLYNRFSEKESTSADQYQQSAKKYFSIAEEIYSNQPTLMNQHQDKYQLIMEYLELLNSTKSETTSTKVASKKTTRKYMKRKRKE